MSGPLATRVVGTLLTIVALLWLGVAKAASAGDDLPLQGLIGPGEAVFGFGRISTCGGSRSSGSTTTVAPASSGSGCAIAPAAPQQSAWLLLPIGYLLVRRRRNALG